MATNSQQQQYNNGGFFGLTQLRETGSGGLKARTIRRSVFYFAPTDSKYNVTFGNPIKLSGDKNYNSDAVTILLSLELGKSIPESVNVYWFDPPSAAMLSEFFLRFLIKRLNRQMQNNSGGSDSGGINDFDDWLDGNWLRGLAIKPAYANYLMIEKMEWLLFGWQDDLIDRLYTENIINIIRIKEEPYNHLEMVGSNELRIHPERWRDVISNYDMAESPIVRFIEYHLPSPYGKSGVGSETIFNNALDNRVVIWPSDRKIKISLAIDSEQQSHKTLNFFHNIFSANCAKILDPQQQQRLGTAGNFGGGGIKKLAEEEKLLMVSIAAKIPMIGFPGFAEFENVEISDDGDDYYAAAYNDESSEYDFWRTIKRFGFIEQSLVPYDRLLIVYNNDTIENISVMEADNTFVAVSINNGYREDDRPVPFVLNENTENNYWLKCEHFSLTSAAQSCLFGYNSAPRDVLAYLAKEDARASLQESINSKLLLNMRLTKEKSLTIDTITEYENTLWRSDYYGASVPSLSLYSMLQSFGISAAADNNVNLYLYDNLAGDVAQQSEFENVKQAVKNINADIAKTGWLLRLERIMSAAYAFNSFIALREYWPSVWGRMEIDFCNIYDAYMREGIGFGIGEANAIVREIVNFHRSGIGSREAARRVHVSSLRRKPQRSRVRTPAENEFSRLVKRGEQYIDRLYSFIKSEIVSLNNDLEAALEQYNRGKILYPPKNRLAAAQT